jgi:type II secretory pathway component PulF
VAVVQAGLEADRLPAALDALADYGTFVQDTRRRVALALLYPGVVAIAAYVLFWVYVVLVTPTIIATLEFNPEKAPPLARTLRGIWETSAIWGPLVPIGLVLLLMFVSRVLASLSSLRGRVGGRFLGGGWFPGVAGMYVNLDRAQTTSLLGLLLKHEVPLPRALRMTGAAARSSTLAAACTRLADGVEHGRSLRSLVDHDPPLPPLLARLFASGEASGRLSEALSQASLIYRRRALRRADWLKMVLPPVLVVLIGGGVTLLYALSLVIPLRVMWSGF